jgi:hypothetical protein
VSVVRTSDEWLSSSRWMAPVHPVTALLLFRPVLTQQPSLSSLLVLATSQRRLSAAQREQTARAAQRRRFKRKPAGRSTFVTWTVDT